MPMIKAEMVFLWSFGGKYFQSKLHKQGKPSAFAHLCGKMRLVWINYKSK
jgi:translation initiation factor IF-1